MEIMLSQLKTLNYPIIALQECFATADYFYNTARSLAEGLHMNYFFYPIRRKARWIQQQWLDSFSGLAILSKYPIEQKHVIDLPGTRDDPERAAIGVAIQYQSTRIKVLNLHLTHLLNENHLRNQQFRKILTDPFSNDPDSLTLFCGDFNCETTSDSLHEFFNSPYLLKDTYSLGGGTLPCYTCPVNDQIPVDKRVKIDHILVGPFQGQYPSFENSKIELNMKDATYQLYPSDHFAVSTKIIL